uniref:DNA mismatch repair protein MSH3 n=1 Tax=Kwoniella bestiolae CBS 10118 TaxID=1296100 RepID=A0A1B9G327_9TREE|nr:hypothetical protein I302_05231 [Kwoniella bestiolae CBS 10118]OCF25411.1 hypothetical protein I302_05231 [Kwoniella bestiolae CBS 10118]
MPVLNPSVASAVHNAQHDVSSYTHSELVKSLQAKSRRDSRASGRGPGPSTRASTRVDDMNEYVVALSQNRGNGVEVGIAVHSLTTGHVADTPFFQRTLQHLTLYPPCTVLVFDTGNQAGEGTNIATKLIEVVEESFELECKPLSRDFWNQDLGTDYIMRLGVHDEVKTSTLMAAADKYYALCATSALFRFLEVRKGLIYPREGLMIRYISSEGTMFIDAETAKNLELTTNALTHSTRDTLYGILNQCLTPMGARLLRGNILQPSNVPHTIEGRLDAVEELLASPERLKSVRDHIKSLGSIDLDRLIHNAARKSQGTLEVQETEARITLLLQIERYVQATTELHQELASSNCKLLKEIQNELADPFLLEIQTKIKGRRTAHDLADDLACLTTGMTALSGKSKSHTTARLYAVKAEFNHLLDVARKTFAENMEDIAQEQHSLPCDLEPIENRFRLVIANRHLDHRGLPKGCVNIERKKTKYGVPSHQRLLLHCNAKLVQAQQEVMLLSGEIVRDLLATVVGYIKGALYCCSDAIAKLDVLACFAELASVRPAFRETIAIKSGRHPILDRSLNTDDCVPNDIYAARGHASFQLIQGPNMSGKSTFLRQVGLLTVQAMLGCYVPVQFGTFRLPDALLSRLSNDDSLDRNLSTFASEMATSAMILGLATKDSVVIIDELGRGTAPLEGLGLSHAIAESLIERQAFVFFTTHFPDLAVTLGSLRGVVCMHLRTQQDNKVEDDNNAFSTSFQYKVDQGPAVIEHYGLELAKLASLPQEVMTRAKEVAISLSELDKKGRDSTASQAMIKRRKLLFELRDKLRHLIENSGADNEALAQTLCHLQQETLDELRKSFESVA